MNVKNFKMFQNIFKIFGLVPPASHDVIILEEDEEVMGDQLEAVVEETPVLVAANLEEETPVLVAANLEEETSSGGGAGGAAAFDKEAKGGVKAEEIYGKKIS
jgi:hypothetical protein